MTANTANIINANQLLSMPINANKMIGNAVPVQLACHVAKAIACQLS